MKNATLAAAVGAGYLLGRFHKAKLAMTVAGLVAGKRLGAGTHPTALAGELLKSQQVEELVGSVRGQLMDAGKKAAMAAATAQVEHLGDRFEQRAAALRKASRAGEPEEEYEEQEERETRADEEEPEEADEERTEARPRRTGGGRRAEAEAEPRRSRSVKESAARKASTKKAAAQKAVGAAKKTAPRKATAKVTAAQAARKIASRRGGERHG